MERVTHNYVFQRTQSLHRRRAIGPKVRHSTAPAPRNPVRPARHRDMRWAVASLVSLLMTTPVVDSSTPSEPLPEDPLTELDPVTVTPPYLYEGDRHLGRLRKSLPDMGGDSPASGAIAAIRKLYEQRKDPNKLDPFQQDVLLRALGEREDF